MALAGTFAIILRILVAAIFGSTGTAVFVYAGLIAVLMVAWCIHYRISARENFQDYMRKFEMSSSLERQQTQSDNSQQHAQLLEYRNNSPSLCKSMCESISMLLSLTYVTLITGFLFPAAMLNMHFSFLDGIKNQQMWNCLLMIFLFFVFNLLGTYLALRFP